MNTETSPTTATPQKARSLRTLVPRVDIYDQGGDIVLLADVPGVPDQALEIQLEKNNLLLSGRAEALGVLWKRSFVLPRDVDAEKVEAVLRDGVVQVRLPRRSEAKPRRIPVSGG